MLKLNAQIITAIALGVLLSSFAAAPVAHSSEICGDQACWQRQYERDMANERLRIALRKDQAEVRYIDSLADQASRDHGDTNINTNVAASTVNNNIKIKGVN